MKNYILTYRSRIEELLKTRDSLASKKEAKKAKKGSGTKTRLAERQAFNTEVGKIVIAIQPLAQRTAEDILSSLKQQGLTLLNGPGTRKIDKIIRDLHLAEWDKEKVDEELSTRESKKAEAPANFGAPKNPGFLDETTFKDWDKYNPKDLIAIQQPKISKSSHLKNNRYQVYLRTKKENVRGESQYQFLGSFEGKENIPKGVKEETSKIHQFNEEGFSKLLGTSAEEEYDHKKHNPLIKEGELVLLSAATHFNIFHLRYDSNGKYTGDEFLGRLLKKHGWQGKIPKAFKDSILDKSNRSQNMKMVMQGPLTDDQVFEIEARRSKKKQAPVEKAPAKRGEAFKKVGEGKSSPIKENTENEKIEFQVFNPENPFDLKKNSIKGISIMPALEEGEWKFYLEKTTIIYEDKIFQHLDPFKYKSIKRLGVYLDLDHIPKQLRKNFKTRDFNYYKNLKDALLAPKTKYTDLKNKSVDKGELFDLFESSFSLIGLDLMSIKFLDDNAQNVEFIFEEDKQKADLKQRLSLITSIDEEDLSEMLKEAIKESYQA